MCLKHESAIRKTFDDFDTSKTESLTVDEATSMIAKLKISVERKYVYPFFKLMDTNNSGTLTF